MKRVPSSFYEVLQTGALIALLSSPLGCKQHGPPLATGAKGAAPAVTQALGTPRTAADPKLRGRVILANKQWPVKMLIGQNARMDLQTNCRAALAAAKKDAAKTGKTVDVPLCFKPGYRSAATHIRVEFDVAGNGAKATSSIRLKGEAAHFLIEPSGSTYQLLDAGLTPRRAGRYQNGEIRILSANKEAHTSLVASLRDLLGPLPLDMVKRPFDIPAPNAPPKQP